MKVDGRRLARLTGGLTLLFALALAQAAGAQCLSQPLSRWAGDGTAEDSCGTNKATPRNGAGFGPGRQGLAFSLDGVDDYVEVPDAPSLDFDGQSHSLTVTAWIFRRSTGAPQVIFDKTSPGPPFVGYRLAVIGDRVILRTDDWKDLKLNCGEAQGAVVTANTWHHVAGVFSRGESRVYLDGALQATCKYLGDGKFQNDVPARMGAFTSATGGFFNGTLDDIQIYNRALTSEDIEALARPRP